MAVTTTQLAAGMKNWDVEVHSIEWGAGSDTTTELSTDLSEIYFAHVNPMFGSNAGHTTGDQAQIEIDETKTDGVITVSGGAVTINRLATDAAGTLAAQSTQVILCGKS